MGSGMKLRDVGLLLGVLALFAVPAAGRAQTAVPAGDIIDKLAAGGETTPDVDVAALKQQAADRVKAKADAAQVKRPLIAPQLVKLTQLRFDVLFDPDSSLIRPGSYGMIGSLADALTDPKLQPYRFLIVDHTESGGRRDFNLTLSQRRADSIRDVLVTTFKISGKRLLALGLGEEQLQDGNRPTAPVNARVQIIAFGKPEIAEPKPATPATAAKKARPRPRKRSADFTARANVEGPASTTGSKAKRAEEYPMFNPSMPAMAGFILGIAAMMTMPANADALKDELAPTGKLRVAIAISPAGGAFWSTKTESGGYAGVPVDLGKAMAAQLGVPVEYVVHNNSGQITDAASKGTWDVTFLPKDPEREARMSFGPIYEVADATYIVKPNSAVTNFATLDQPGIKVAAVNNTTTMRGAIAHLKNAEVTGYQTYDEIAGLLGKGEIDAFALSRDQLNAMAKKIPGTKVLDETFKQTVTAVAVPPNHPQALVFASQFLTEAITNGTLRKAYDGNGLKDTPIRTQTK